MGRLTKREMWVSERAKGVGASEVSAILGLNPWKSAFALWVEKTMDRALIAQGLVPEQAPPNEAMQLGIDLEGYVLRQYRKRTGRKVTRNTLPSGVPRRQDVCPALPILRASVDADVDDPEKGAGIAEAKVTRDVWQGDAPLYYQVQVQAQFACTGRPWGSLVGLCGLRAIEIIELEPNVSFRDEVMLPAIHEFWQRVERDIPPDADASESTRDAIKKMWPRATGPSLLLPAPYTDIDAELEAVKAELKGLEERKRGLENRILAAVKDAEGAALPNGVIYTYYEQERKESVVPASRFRVLRRKAAKG